MPPTLYLLTATRLRVTFVHCNQISDGASLARKRWALRLICVGRNAGAHSCIDTRGFGYKSVFEDPGHAIKMKPTGQRTQSIIPTECCQTARHGLRRNAHCVEHRQAGNWSHPSVNDGVITKKIALLHRLTRSRTSSVCAARLALQLTHLYNFFHDILELSQVTTAAATVPTVESKQALYNWHTNERTIFTYSFEHGQDSFHNRVVHVSNISGTKTYINLGCISLRRKKISTMKWALVCKNISDQMHQKYSKRQRWLLTDYQYFIDQRPKPQTQLQNAKSLIWTRMNTFLDMISRWQQTTCHQHLPWFYC